jgi:hypothetical protein
MVLKEEPHCQLDPLNIPDGKPDLIERIGSFRVLPFPDPGQKPGGPFNTVGRAGGAAFGANQAAESR